MSMSKRLYDPERLTQIQNRAKWSGPALFLQEAVCSELVERLKDINRAFKAPKIVAYWPEIWSSAMKTPHVIVAKETLDLEPMAHDLVLHALALHWAEDPVGQLIQCRRSLRPDGLFLGALFGGETLTELRSTLAAAEIEISGGLSPRVAPMGDIRTLGNLMQRAGFALPVADSFKIVVEYDGIFALMRDLRAMGESNALADRMRQPTRRAIFERADMLYREAFGTKDDRIPATFEIVVLTGWAPDESQQKPLRPGSASHHLSDVLRGLSGEKSQKDE